MTRARATLVLWLLIVATVVSVGGASAQSGALDGTWDGTWSWSSYSGRIVLHLAQKGEAVEGTYDVYGGRQGDQVGVAVKGTLKGDRLTLSVPSNPQGGFEATVKGDEMSGAFRGRTATNNFSARKVSKPK